MSLLTRLRVLGNNPVWLGLFLHFRTCQLSNSRESCLRRIQTQPKIFVGECREHVDWLMPCGAPSPLRMHPAFVFAKADRGYEIHEWSGICIRHVRTDSGWIIGRILFVGVAKMKCKL